MKFAIVYICSVRQLSHGGPAIISKCRNCKQISHRRPLPVDDAELGHFTLLFCKRAAEKWTKFYNAHAPLLFYLLNLLFDDILVFVVVVACLSSLLSLHWCARLHSVLVLWSGCISNDLHLIWVTCHGNWAEYYSLHWNMWRFCIKSFLSIS